MKVKFLACFSDSYFCFQLLSDFEQQSFNLKKIIYLFRLSGIQNEHIVYFFFVRFKKLAFFLTTINWKFTVGPRYFMFWFSGSCLVIL